MSRRTPKPEALSVWQLFCSVKLTLFLLFLIAAGSVAGTLIQQNLPKEDYFRVWEPGTANFFLRSGLTDVYHSWWFLGLMGLLAFNLIACSVDRFPAILAAYRGQPNPASEILKAQAFHRSFVLPGTLVEARELARKALGHGAVDGKLLYLSRGAYARWGVFVVHSSLLVIFLGVMIGSLWGFKGFINIVEGTSTREVVLRGGADDEHEHRKAIPFELHVDSFKVSRYETGQPSDFVSHVRVLENGQTVKEKDLRVNDPLSYRGLTFYQSSYGPAPEATFLLQNAKTGALIQVPMALNEVRMLEGGIALAFDAFAEDHNRMGPAFQLRMQVPGQEAQELMLFQRLPDYDRQRGDVWTLKVGDLRLKQYTGLQVAKDPGVPWVWAGCALMILGMMGAFFCSHRQIWIRLEERKDGVAWTVAGATSRNRLAFEKEFQVLLERIGAPEASKSKEGKA
ncbi:cytochrome c biogenesis protein ResB [Holophaga foetida]|uniref:cytochrome c biogenesis protein ResB n=1 Tax=Holophaga foetida TaxID=35839 RepID=UPI000247428D|nr:cytochrome c biogenesis protein ResB [Holophaga foetida]